MSILVDFAMLSMWSAAGLIIFNGDVNNSRNAMISNSLMQ